MSGPDIAERVAEALVGAPIVGLTQVGGGRNSRVFRVDSERGAFALKQYPPREEDSRDRLGAEARALEWMEEHGLSNVPRVVALDRERNFALLSWREGALVRDVGPADVDQAIAFLSRLHELRISPAMPASTLAAEACLSGAEIERQVRLRLAQLRAIADEPALRQFLDEVFEPALEKLIAQAKARLGGGTGAFEATLPESERSLAPSDFGFHNALRRDDGALSFIDFEYFGWDDPVKLTADILLHPGTPVSDDLRARFRAGAERIYASDRGFARRLEAFYPLFGLRWGLILLNEFYPERWRRRLLAGAAPDWTEAKARQLRAARELLSRLPT